jgi:hypothetical protein
MIVAAFLGLTCALFLLLVIMRWIDRRDFLVLKEGPHKSCIRLADQLDTAWRKNRRRQRDL